MVIPSYYWNLCPDYCHVFPSYDGGEDEAHSGFSPIPSRSWLIAILETLIEDHNH